MHKTILHTKASGSESWGQGKAACMHVFMPMQPLQWVVYADGSSKFLKCYSPAAITAIYHLVYYRPSTFS